MATQTQYRISNAEGLTGGAWGATFATEDEAAEAIREAHGWDDVVVSESFAAGDGNDSAVCAYETQEECDADEDGAHAPRITSVEVAAPVAQ